MMMIVMMIMMIIVMMMIVMMMMMIFDKSKPCYEGQRAPQDDQKQQTLYPE